MVKSVSNAGDLCLIPGLGRPPAEGKASHISMLAWNIPWSEEPGGLQSIESQSRTRLSNTFTLSLAVCKHSIKYCVSFNFHWNLMI